LYNAVGVQDATPLSGENAATQEALYGPASSTGFLRGRNLLDPEGPHKLAAPVFAAAGGSRARRRGTSAP
jgi:hypothetical protein